MVFRFKGAVQKKLSNTKNPHNDLGFLHRLVNVVNENHFMVLTSITYSKESLEFKLLCVTLHHWAPAEQFVNWKIKIWSHGRLLWKERRKLEKKTLSWLFVINVSLQESSPTIWTPTSSLTSCIRARWEPFVLHSHHELLRRLIPHTEESSPEMIFIFIVLPPPGAAAETQNCRHQEYQLPRWDANTRHRQNQKRGIV